MILKHFPDFSSNMTPSLIEEILYMKERIESYRYVDLIL